jgi:hypothetical protein
MKKKTIIGDVSGKSKIIPNQKYKRNIWNITVIYLKKITFRDNQMGMEELTRFYSVMKQCLPV